MLRRNVTRCASRNNAQAFDFVKGHYNNGIGRVFPDLVMGRAKDSYMFNKDGVKYLDLVMGIGVCNLGHNPDELLPAVHAAVDNMWHAQTNLGFSAPMEKFVDLMLRKPDGSGVLPFGFDSVLCLNSGSEIVEAAIKLSRTANPGRPVLAALQGGYHGRTLGAASLTTSKYSYNNGIKPLLPGIVVLPSPYHSFTKDAFTTPVAELSARCLEQAEDVFTQQCNGGTEVSMLIAEPVMGEGGFVALDATYWKGLRDLCKRNNILLCADEIQCGFGRNGCLFMTEQYGAGAEPDMMTVAKGLANGLPLSALVTRKDIGMKAIPGTQGGTYAGNCLAVAAANASAELFYANPTARAALLENVWARSAQFVAGLQKIIAKHNLPIDEIRGRGLLIGIEWNRGIDGIGAAFSQECYRRKALLLPTGKFQAVRLIPSLRITEQETSDALAIIEEAAVAAVAAAKPEQVKKATGGKSFSHFWEDGFLPDSPKPNVPLRWVVMRK